MMALEGIELETLVSKPDALTTRPPPYIKVLKKLLHVTKILLKIL